ncbi:hypothetical protein I3F58_16450 [Streptomyces sp. MUM 203J]|uniref:hypothetical protein n=1 Tax=Streptomyces sp. MUM 203J TaxID=2791990 RepID=UPI0027E49DB7|nr:hypothetical protein [Streptomyces sp. MUM 203J]MCH0541131.1 hypothetical protein [Streptomyces sp. MUM 203J]
MAVDLSFYESYLVEEIRDEARAEARAESRAQDILRLLERRGVTVPDSVRERVTGCEDPEAMVVWFDRAITATHAEEIFGEQ